MSITSFPAVRLMYDGYGNPIKSLDGAVNIHDADIHTRIVNDRFRQHTTPSTTLAVDAAAQATSITVTSAVGFAVGDFLHIQNGTIETTHPQITAIVGAVFTLDRPLDNPYSIGDTVQKTLQTMNVVGTLASPQSFKVQPYSTDVWHLTRILIEMTHGTAGDNGLFGDLPALTNGVLLRRYDGTSGLYNTFTNWKTNSDIVTDMYDVTYSSRSGGGGSYGTNARGTFTNAGAVVRLDAAAGDFLEILVQDNLSALASFRVKAQGHYEGL